MVEYGYVTGTRVLGAGGGAHHLAGEIGEQDFPFVGRVENRTLAESRSKDLALRLQGLDLLSDEARLILAKIEKPTGQKRQGQHVDREDAARVDRTALAALELRGVALPRPQCVHLLVGPAAPALRELLAPATA